MGRRAPILCAGEPGRGGYPIAVVGPGALGLTFASQLARTGPVAVIARDEARGRTLRRGVQIGHRVYRPDAFGPSTAPQAEWVILLVKAGDTEAAAEAIRRMRPRGVISLQNGLLDGRLRAALPGVQASQGVTTEAAYRSCGSVVRGGVGETLVPPGFEAVAEQLNRAGISARVEGAIQAARLRKFLVNLVINPLTALFRVPNGALLGQSLRPHAEALLREAWPVLNAEGLGLDEACAGVHVFGIARATASNRSSMLQDVCAGRKTELDAITGAFLQLAIRHRATAPTHTLMFHLLAPVKDGRVHTGQRRRALWPDPE